MRRVIDCHHTPCRRQPPPSAVAAASAASAASAGQQVSVRGHVRPAWLAACVADPREGGGALLACPRIGGARGRGGVALQGEALAAGLGVAVSLRVVQGGQLRMDRQHRAPWGVVALVGIARVPTAECTAAGAGAWGRPGQQEARHELVRVGMDGLLDV